VNAFLLNNILVATDGEKVILGVEKIDNPRVMILIIFVLDFYR